MTTLLSAHGEGYDGWSFSPFHLSSYRQRLSVQQLLAVVVIRSELREIIQSVHTAWRDMITRLVLCRSVSLAARRRADNVDYAMSWEGAPSAADYVQVQPP